MSAAENVYSLPINSVYRDFETFFGKQESKHTQDNYRRAIKFFFSFIKQGKRIEDLTYEDLIFRNADIELYKTHLKKQFESLSTANLYLAALFSLYGFLEKNYEGIFQKTIKVDFFKANQVHHGKLSQYEAEMMAELAKREVHGQEKYSLIRLAFTTSIRKSALLSLKWSDIKKRPDDDIYTIRAVDKGQKVFEVDIVEDLYNELLKIKECKKNQKYNDNNVFHLSNDTVQKMMDTLKEKMGVSPERNITFHSFRSLGAIYAVRVMKDIRKAQKVLGHKDINLTLDTYGEDADDYRNAPSILMDQKISDDVFYELSKEDLIALIKGQSDGTQMVMKIAAKKMLETRNEKEDEKESLDN
jgi:integrase